VIRPQQQVHQFAMVTFLAATPLIPTNATNRAFLLDNGPVNRV
jgi:hypothetical protein